MKTQEADPLSATNKNFYLEGAALTVDSCGELNGGSSVLNLGEYGIFCVADGVGDPIGGKKASEEIVEAIEQKFWDTKFEDEKGVLATVKEALGRAKIRIIRIAQDYKIGKMGASVAILHLNPIKNSAFIIHAGNCRVYRFRDGSLTKLTEDHSVAAEMGLSDDDDISHIVQENLTRAVGLFGRTNLETTSLEFQANDFYLLCSHGLTKSLQNSEICEILASHRQADINVVLNHLSDKTKQAEPSENVSFVLVKIVEEKTPDEIVQKKKSLPIPIPILLGIALVFIFGLLFLLKIDKTKVTSLEVSDNQVLNGLPSQREDAKKEVTHSPEIENERLVESETPGAIKLERVEVLVKDLESTPKPIEDTFLSEDVIVKNLTPSKENENLVKKTIPESIIISDKENDNSSARVPSEKLEHVEPRQLNSINPSAQENYGLEELSETGKSLNPIEIDPVKTNGGKKESSLKTSEKSLNKQISLAGLHSKPLEPEISLENETQTQNTKSLDNLIKIGDHKGPTTSEIAPLDGALKTNASNSNTTVKKIPRPVSTQSQNIKSNSDTPLDKISLDKKEKEEEGDAPVAIMVKENIKIPPPQEIKVNTILKDFKKTLQNNGLADAMDQVEDKWQAMTLDEKEPVRTIIMKTLLGSSLKFRNNNYEGGDEIWEILKRASTIKEPSLSLHMRKLSKNFENDFRSCFNRKVIQAQKNCQWVEVFIIIENNPTISRDLIPLKLHSYVDVWSELSSGSSEGVQEIKDFIERTKLVSHKIQPLLEVPNETEVNPISLAEMELFQQVEICQQYSQIRNDLHKKINGAIERLDLNLSIIDVSSLELLIRSAYLQDTESNWKDKKLEVVKTGLNQLKKFKVQLNPEEKILAAKDEMAVFEQIAEEIVPLLEEVQDHLLFVSILVKKIKQISENEGQLIVADMNLINDFSSQFTAVSSLFPTEIARNLNQRFSQSLASGD